VGFFVERQRRSRKAKMAGKKDARAKAGPDDGTEKNKTKHYGGTKGGFKDSGQGAAGEVQRRPLQEQPGVNPERSAQGQMEDIKEGWEAMKGMDKVLDHFERRLDRSGAHQDRRGSQHQCWLLSRQVVRRRRTLGKIWKPLSSSSLKSTG
jgi:hypothetical protein